MPGVPTRQYSQLKAGVAGHGVLPRGAGGGERGGARGRQHAASLPAERSRRREPFAANVADYAVSADGKKLLYRTARAAGGPDKPARDAGAAVAVPRRRRQGRRRRPAQGRLDVTLRMHLDPKAEFKQIFNEGWRNQRDYLYVPNMHGAELADDEGDVRRRCCRT